MTCADRRAALEAAARERILVLDGALGTEIQARGLTEADYRGDRFAMHRQDLKGNNDVLNLTRPALIEAIHHAYFEAGADIAEANTFNANAISQADYGLADLAYELNRAGAAIARRAADACSAAQPHKPRFVAGVLGPTGRTASLSPDVNDPGARNVTFDALREAYKEAARGLIDGGADLILVETVFDTLNAKAALFTLDELFEHDGRALPVMISGTITDKSGRTLSGQTVVAFWHSLRHARPFSIGLNCALGAAELRPYVAELARIADVCVSAHPNAGLPNAFGAYDETPTETAAHLDEWSASGLVNIVGGCCGTTPAHIRAIAEAAARNAPRAIPRLDKRLRLSGLEPFTAAA